MGFGFRAYSVGVYYVPSYPLDTSTTKILRRGEPFKDMAGFRNNCH